MSSNSDQVSESVDLTVATEQIRIVRKEEVEPSVGDAPAEIRLTEVDSSSIETHPGESSETEVKMEDGTGPNEVGMEEPEVKTENIVPNSLVSEDELKRIQQNNNHRESACSIQACDTADLSPGQHLTPSAHHSQPENELLIPQQEAAEEGAEFSGSSPPIKSESPEEEGRGTELQQRGVGVIHFHVQPHQYPLTQDMGPSHGYDKGEDPVLQHLVLGYRRW